MVGYFARRARQTVGWAFALILVPACLGAQTEEAVRELVERQAYADYGLHVSAWPSVLPTVRIEVLEGPRLGPLQIWRGQYSAAHGTVYLAAEIDGEVLPMGGFPAPSVASAVEALAEDPPNQQSLMVLADRVAILLDEFGGYRVLSDPRSGLDQDVWAKWTDSMPGDWPVDGVEVREDGGWGLRKTVLTQDTRSYAGAWRAEAYALELDSAGRLLAWSKRSGAAFTPR